MTEASCVVAVDVGNSAIKLCTRKDNEVVDHSIGMHQSDWHRDAVAWAQGQLGCRDAYWRIGSVHRQAADKLESYLRDNQKREPDRQTSIHRITRKDVPMKVDVDDPDRLGIDRLLSGYAASNRFDGPLVVVDAGSAVTVDWVDTAKTFCGGAILPGLRMQTAALAAGTDALPEIDWQQSVDMTAPATNTVDAIRLGVLSAVVGAIEVLTDQYHSDQHHPPGDEPSEPIRIILTGGDSPLLSKSLRRKHKLLPNMVCHGLLDLPKNSNR